MYFILIESTAVASPSLLAFTTNLYLFCTHWYRPENLEQLGFSLLSGPHSLSLGMVGTYALDPTLFQRPSLVPVFESALPALRINCLWSKKKKIWLKGFHQQGARMICESQERPWLRQWRLGDGQPSRIDNIAMVFQMVCFMCLGFCGLPRMKNEKQKKLKEIARWPSRGEWTGCAKY